MNTSVGFAGYLPRGPQEHFEGQLPAVVLARWIESGTSKTQKHPFVRKTLQAARAEAEAAMQQGCRERIDKLIQEG